MIRDNTEDRQCLVEHLAVLASGYKNRPQFL
jgi:hypothetical protein